MHWNVPPDALSGSAMFVLFWTAGLTTALLQLHRIHTLPRLHAIPTLLQLHGIHSLPQLQVIHTFLTLLQSSHTSFTFATTCSCSILTAVPILNASVGQCETIMPCSWCLTSFFCHQEEKLVPPWLSFKKLMCQSKVPTLAIKLASHSLERLSWQGVRLPVFMTFQPCQLQKESAKELTVLFFSLNIGDHHTSSNPFEMDAST